MELTEELHVGNVLTRSANRKRVRQYERLIYSIITIGTLLRISMADKLPWREDEFVYVKWTGSWFSSHLLPYLLQFQQTIYPPKSPVFANPPGAMWLFGIAIEIGRVFHVGPLLAARLCSVTLYVFTSVIYYKLVSKYIDRKVALLVVIFISFTPLIVVTQSSAFLEPLLALLLVLAITTLLRLVHHPSNSNAIRLGVVLGLSLVTKFSLVFLFIAIGVVGFYRLSIISKRTGAALLLLFVSLFVPLILWSGFRTPSQYVGIIYYLGHKHIDIANYIQPWRYLFSLLSDVPLSILIFYVLGLLHLSQLLFSRKVRVSLPALCALLPLIGIPELMLTAPTSLDYQMVPFLPCIIILSFQTMQSLWRRIRLRWIGYSAVVTSLIGLVIMYSYLPLIDLGLANTIAGRLVRATDPTIDVPYGTGSELIPTISKFIRNHLPKNAFIAATYDNYPLSEYVGPSQRVGPWFPHQSIQSLSLYGYDYAFIAYHYTGYSGAAIRSIKDLRPLFQVKVGGLLLGDLYKVPSPTCHFDGPVPTGSWIVASHNERILTSITDPTTIEISSSLITRRDSWLEVINTKKLHVHNTGCVISLKIYGNGEASNIYVDLMTRVNRGNYFRAVIPVSWIGPQQVTLTGTSFSAVVVDARSTPPRFGKGIVLRLATDGTVSSHASIHLTILGIS